MREDAERERLRRQQEFEDEMRKKKDEMQILNQKEELNNKLNEIKMKEEQLRFQQNMILQNKKHIEEMNDLANKKNMELNRLEQIKQEKFSQNFRLNQNMSP